MRAVSEESLFRKIRRQFVRALVASARLLPEERESIWSVPRELQVVYFLVFIGLCVPMIIHIVRQVLAGHPDAGIVALATETASRFATVGAGAAIGTLIIVQGVYLVMLALYHILTNRFAKPVIQQHEARGVELGEARGEARGVERSNREWRQWLQDREEHEAQGLPFDQPPPDERQSDDEPRRMP